MDVQATHALLRFFRTLQNPRALNARHPFSDLRAIAILAVLCGSDSWESVEAWGCGNSGERMAVTAERWLGHFGLNWPDPVDALESDLATDLQSLPPDDAV